MRRHSSVSSWGSGLAVAAAILGWSVVAVRADQATLKYDPASGHVVIDPANTPTNTTIAFSLLAPSGQMTPIEPNRLPLLNTDGNEQYENSSELIEFLDLLLEGKPGVLDLGPILPAGLDDQALAQFLAAAMHIYDRGKGGRMNLVVIPEPAGGIVWGLGLLATLCSLRPGSRRVPRSHD